MKNAFRSLFAVAIGGLVSYQANAGIVADWTFEASGAQNSTALSGSAVNYDANNYDTGHFSAAKISAVTLGANTASQDAAAGNGSATAMQFVPKPGKNVNNSSFVLSLTTSGAISSTTLVLSYELQVAAIGLFSSQFDLLLDMQKMQIELSHMEDLEAVKQINNDLADALRKLYETRTPSKSLLTDLLSWFSLPNLNSFANHRP